ncbi:MAG: FlgD immunoglobulin-like domain containing protein [Candidatus Eisenbacteria bacterium]
MRKCFAMMAVVLLAGGASDSLAKDTQLFQPNVAAPRAGELLGDVPAGAVPQSYTRAPGDTLCFGYVDGDGFAVANEVWTFDHGAGGAEGWYGVDVTEQSSAYFRHITDAIWDADPDNVVPAPVLTGTGSAWVGVFGGESLDLCWSGGLGYGNDWCQRILSPVQSYGGSGNVAINWRHFNDTEENFDYTNVYLRLLPSQDETSLKQYTFQIGLGADPEVDPPVGVVDNDVLTAADFAGSTQYQLVFEVTSDGSWSDEDNLNPTAFGPAGFDDVNIGANNYNFDAGLQGWTPEACPGFGTFFGIAPLTDYIIEDPCQCELTGNILEMHRGIGQNGDHIYGQHSYAVSPEVDVLNDVTPSSLPGVGQLSMFVDWDQYSVMPRANGVFYRPGAYYFPYLCEVTGNSGWSPRVGQNTFFFVGEDPTCAGNRASLTATDVPVPVDAQNVQFIFEIYASCDAFGIGPADCTQVTNFTPIIDNVKICFTRVPEAPPIAIDNGLRFQDGFVQSGLINNPNPTEVGRADVTRNIVGFGNTNPFVLGDSLMVAGPVVTTAATEWEAHLWFRVARSGPLSGAAYTNWVADVNGAGAWDIEAGDFAKASMDSCQQGTNAFKNKFCTYLKEEDWATWGRSAAGPELSDEVEIIQDNVLWPGTQIEYFLTSNFKNPDNGQKYFLPDTTGGFFSEFEILPSWRNTGSGLRYPCLLYIDAFNAGAQNFIQAAVDSLGYDIDRYDYLDASSNWKAPMARGGTVDANNGCTLPQLLGYRGLLINSGSSNITQMMWPEDYAMFSDWLTAVICDANSTRQGLVMNGDGMSLALSANAPTLLARMGASHVDDWYAEFYGNQGTCVGIEEPAGGSLYGTAHSANDYVYDAYGNWCPQQFNFDVLGTVGTGVGNRVYLNLDTLDENNYASVANEQILGGGATENYRTVLDGVSWHHTTDSVDDVHCDTAEQNIVNATFNQIASAIEWIYEVDYDLLASLCEDPCASGVVGIEDGGIATGARTTLFQNSPNPFNPHTSIRFQLANSGPAELAVFDVSGRKVRTLVKGNLDAGDHAVTWDGMDEAGRPLASGVYWTQLTADGRTFNKKATVLR